MKTNRFSLRHRARVGPGGWFCPCCAIPPKLRKGASRLLKRRVYRELNKFENTAE